MKRTFRYLMVMVIAAGFAAGAGQLMAGKPGGGGCPTPRVNCLCPDIVDPVICDGGCTYTNQCRADCAKATHCVPGDYVPQ
jgi:hypothetical protein